MNRNSNVRFAKPSLEQLEGRDMPSFLLGGAVGQLATQLQNVVGDMQNAEKDLVHQAQIANNPNVTQTQAFLALGKVTADFQRIQNDQHAIQTASNADVGFINAVALAEFQNGDSLDLIVLNFGGIFGLHPTSQLTDPVGQANGVFGQAQKDITSLDATLALLGTSVEQEAPSPSF